MRLRVKTRNIEVSEPIRDYAEFKIGKLEKYLLGDPEVEVELSGERNPSRSDSPSAKSGQSLSMKTNSL